MREKPVAFFDIDGTVFRSSLLVELVEELVVQGIFPNEALTMYHPAYTAWSDRTGSYDAYITAVVQSFLKYIQGVSYTDFSIAGQKIVSHKGKNVYRYTRDYIAELKSLGYVIVAISQSPKVVLDEFCQVFGFDKVYGRRYEMDINNRFTGHVLDEELITDKASIVSRVFERHPEYTTVGSVAVGDTEGDISLLQAVDKPICFNPNEILYQHACTYNWPVVVERKDVIYQIQ